MEAVVIIVLALSSVLFFIAGMSRNDWVYLWISASFLALAFSL